MSTHRVNCEGLHRLLDKQRQERGMSWRQVAAETGLAASTFHRLKAGGAPDGHALLSLLVWLGMARSIRAVLRPGGES